MLKALLFLFPVAVVNFYIQEINPLEHTAVFYVLAVLMSVSIPCACFVSCCVFEEEHQFTKFTRYFSIRSTGWGRGEIREMEEKSEYGQIHCNDWGCPSEYEAINGGT